MRTPEQQRIHRFFTAVGKAQQSHEGVGTSITFQQLYELDQDGLQALIRSAKKVISLKKKEPAKADYPDHGELIDKLSEKHNIKHPEPVRADDPQPPVAPVMVLTNEQKADIPAGWEDKYAGLWRRWSGKRSHDHIMGIINRCIERERVSENETKCEPESDNKLSYVNPVVEDITEQMDKNIEYSREYPMESYHYWARYICKNIKGRIDLTVPEHMSKKDSYLFLAMLARKIKEPVDLYTEDGLKHAVDLIKDRLKDHRSYDRMLTKLESCVVVV